MEPLPVDARPLRRVLHGQGVHLSEHGERVVVNGERFFEQVVLEEIGTLEKALQVRLELIVDECLDGRCAGTLLEMHAVRVVLVTALPVLPGHRRVVPELVEPGADEGIAALHLVVQEAEREGPVHRLDPEREAAELDRKRIEVHRVDAALDHVPAKHRLQARLEALVVRRAGDQLVTEAGVDDGFGTFFLGLRGFGLPRSAMASSVTPEAEQPHEGALAVGLDPTVVLERGVERIGEKAKRGEGKGPGPARGIAYGEREDLLGPLRGPARGRRVPVRHAVGAGRRVPGERAQGPLHGRHGKPRAGVEAPGALAGPAPAHEVPLAEEDDTGDELPCLGSHAALEREPTLGRIPAPRLPDECGHLGCAPRPHLCPRAVLLPFVRAGRVSVRNGVFGVGIPRFGRGPLHGFVEQVSIGQPTRIAPFLPAGVWRLAGSITALLAFRQFIGARRALLQALEQRLERPILHRFEARERQGRLVAHREEDHGSLGGAVLSS